MGWITGGVALLVLQGVLAAVMTAFAQTRLPGMILLALTFLLSAFAVTAGLAHRRKLALLRVGVEEFMETGKEPDFSLKDDRYTPLENAIARLAHQTAVQREAVQRENRDMADFIGDVSHQLKTPLASLRLYNELQGGPDADKQLAVIERMEQLIYSLLRLQKLKAGAYELTFVPWEMGDIVRELTQELKPLYPRKQFTLQGSSGPIRCDEYWMGEALMNIMKNACEHTAQEGRVCVNLSRQERSVLLTVEDDGGGVPEAQLPRLFWRFYGPAPRGKGSGLGLAITRAVVEKHHGSISAENTGTGLRITLCLPVLDGVLPVPEGSLKKT